MITWDSILQQMEDKAHVGESLSWGMPNTASRHLIDRKRSIHAPQVRQEEAGPDTHTVECVNPDGGDTPVYTRWG